MLELLPNKQKKDVKREYALRRLTVALILLSIAGIISLASISPSYFLSIEKEKIVKKEFERAEKANNEKTDDKAFQDDIKRTKEMINLLKPSDKYVSIGEIISNIVDNKNSGVRIDGINITSYKGNQYQIILNGNAASRDILKSFAEHIKNAGLFEGVDLPISNFTKIADIDFNITLKTVL